MHVLTYILLTHQLQQPERIASGPVTLTWSGVAGNAHNCQSPTPCSEESVAKVTMATKQTGQLTGSITCIETSLCNERQPILVRHSSLALGTAAHCHCTVTLLVSCYQGHLQVQKKKVLQTSSAVRTWRADDIFSAHNRKFAFSKPIYISTA